MRTAIASLPLILALATLAAHPAHPAHLADAAVIPLVVTPAEIRLVEVPAEGYATMRELESLGFDVAGIDRVAMKVGVAAGPEELARLKALGYGFTVKEVSGPLRGRGEALPDYTDPKELEAFLLDIQSRYPDLVKVYRLADELFEGQVQYAVKITAGVNQPNERSSFLLDAQHHAREVMGPEVAKDMVEYLATRYESDPQVKEWLDNINIYIVPSVNPDGAMYVFEHDRMWRKNRNPACGLGKEGIDLNRNYSFNWNFCGGSSDICTSLLYRGTGPASEPEVRGMEQVMDGARALFHLTIHAYGEYIIYPYGCYGAGQVPAEESLLRRTANGLSAVLETDSGTLGGYDVSPPGINDGMALDTAYGKYGIYSFLIEIGRSFQPDYARLWDLTVPREREGGKYFLDQTLNAPQIRGRVVDAITGEPLAASVSLAEVRYPNGEFPRHADQRGVFQFLAESWKAYTATFTLPGYCVEQRQVAVEDGPADLFVAMTKEGQPVPLLPSCPPDCSEAQPLDLTLAWDDPGPEDYDVFFGTEREPPFYKYSQAKSLQLSGLQPETQYFWRVLARRGMCLEPGPVWSFTTIASKYKITGVYKQNKPFRLLVLGDRFDGECRIMIDGKAAPKTVLRSPGELLAKGGAALKAMVPKGRQVLVTVEDGQGNRSNRFVFSW